ncbi:MAG: hypothetical protein Q8941_04555, partial [Bacteroidota bacterium]|nr:hypothetical protein [Bacteroidota bacterium]
MISVTGYKKFKKCRRQWFYSTVAADTRVKNDAFRREVTLLSKLLTVSAWRGTIVDNVLSKYLVTAINNKYPIKKDYFIAKAMDIFDKQLDYAVNKRYREP